MYRPLPNGLTVKNSVIEGLGLFSVTQFKAGTVLGIAHIADTNWPDGYIRTALGAFYNHSNDPNCILQDGYWQDKNVKYLVIKEDISWGIELTCSYSLYKFEP